MELEKIVPQPLPVKFAPLPKDCERVFILWRENKDRSRIGILVAANCTPVQWLGGHAKANDQKFGTDARTRTEREHFICEAVRHGLLNSLYLIEYPDVTRCRPSELPSIESQRETLVEWARERAIYLVHGKGGCL